MVMGHEIGRVNQKRRTYNAILQAAIELIRTGREVTMPGVARSALVSEATAYRCFPESNRQPDAERSVRPRSARQTDSRQSVHRVAQRQLAVQRRSNRLPRTGKARPSQFPLVRCVDHQTSTHVETDVVDVCGGTVEHEIASH
jgi:hypothetical protein